LTREQLIDIALLVGTDYNEGVKGIGVKKALKLIGEQKNIFNALSSLGLPLNNLEKIRNFYIGPPVEDSYVIRFRSPEETKIIEFLCEEHDFSKSRVEKAVEKLKNLEISQMTLEDWF
jgi:flap endonuclease-1